MTPVKFRWTGAPFPKAPVVAPMVVCDWMVPVSPGLLLAAGPGAQARSVSHAGWQSIALLLRPEFLGAHLSVRQHTEEFRLPRGLEQRHASAAKSHQMFDWGKRLTDAAALEPEPFNDSADHRAVAQLELVETLIDTLRKTADREPDRQEMAKQEQSRHRQRPVLQAPSGPDT